MSFHVLPGPKGTCPECNVAHPADEPHDRQSLAYQYRFYGQHGRWPTWRDAIAHCEEGLRAAWEDELRKVGAWDGWTGDTPPAPDVMPAADGGVGSIMKRRKKS